MQKFRALDTLPDPRAPLVFSGFLPPLVGTLRNFRSYAHIKPPKYPYLFSLQIFWTEIFMHDRLFY